MSDFPDGIYFNLNDSTYHALPRLSSSGICNMLVSPSNYWADSWLSRKDEEEKDEEATRAQILGSAWHVARLEPHLFEGRYIRALDKADFPTALMNGTQIGEALAEKGETKKKAGESVLQQALRLKEAGYGGEIWPLIEDEFEQLRGDRIAITAKFYDDIIEGMDRIKAQAEIVKHLVGGAAEVSILWTDEKGTQKKARVDYLRPDERTDFKTFDNARKKELERCIVEAIQYNRYYIQAAFYDEAVEQIRLGKLKIIGKATDDERDLVDQIKDQDRPLPCWYIFQEKNGIPNLLAREIKLYSDPHESHAVNDAGADEQTSAKVAEMTIKPTALMAKARTEIKHAEGLYRFYMEEFCDREPWPPLTPTAAITDDMFSSYWLES